ncbi:MAG: glycosyltransferase [Winogradskyella sp.]
MTFLTILFIAFTVIVGIQVVFYTTFLFAFSTKKDKLGLDRPIPISVIICAKNEAENLKQNLPIIINQNYDNFEIVLVNDCSYDNTLEVMEQFKAKHNNIKIVDVKDTEAFWGNKKYALTLGIKASSFETLVFTDADCYPNSDQWLKHMSSKFSKEKHIVLGYGAYAKKKFSLLNSLIRFETVLTALQYFSYSNIGMPYMAVGRNMAYRKELFFNNSGFNNHMFVRSGDDDLFVNEVADSKNTAICYTNESFTISNPKTSFKDWFTQKRRHISTSKYYKPLHKFVLVTFYSSQLLFWIFAIVLLISQVQWQWILALILLRFIVQMLSFGLTAKKLNEGNLIYISPVLELFLITFQLIIFSANKISTPKHWK